MQIGTFKNNGRGYIGIIHTLTLKAEVTLEPNRNTGPKAPALRVFHNGSEVGIAFAKTSEKGNPYLSVLLDDPSFTGPVYATLIQSDNSEHKLIWSR